MSILGRAIQDRFPKYFAYFQTRSFQYGSRTIRGHNRLLGKVEGVDGIKTGYTRLSGFNLLTSVNTDTRSIVAVVLGGRSGASRDQKMASLIDSNLPRAYAGARTLRRSSRLAPAMVAEAPAPRPVEPAPVTVPVRVASAVPQAPVAQAATPQAAPERRPLDLNTLRPVVASAAGASSTTTPSSTSTVRWQKGPEALPAECAGLCRPARPTDSGLPEGSPPGQDRAQGRRAGSGRSCDQDGGAQDGDTQDGRRRGQEDRERLGDPARRDG